MSQAARALVERLKKETSHLPGNAPMHNIALITICSILDELVEPVEEVEEAPADEAPASEPEPAPDPEPAAEAPADESVDEEAAQDDGSGPMTTGNAPT